MWNLRTQCDNDGNSKRGFVTEGNIETLNARTLGGFFSLGVESQRRTLWGRNDFNGTERCSGTQALGAEALEAVCQEKVVARVVSPEFVRKMMIKCFLSELTKPP